MSETNDQGKTAPEPCDRLPELVREIRAGEFRPKPVVARFRFSLNNYDFADKL
jgi:hypothetical protein